MTSPSPARRLLGAATLLGGTALTLAAAAPASAETEVPRPDTFTSAFTVMATPDQVVDMEGNPAPGEPGATGTFDFMVNSDEEIICYDITLTGVTGDYESPAKTATHIHEAAAGEPGPPRIAFPNPEGDGDTRTASGCLQGPFTTGVEDDAGADTGEGFTLAQLEANPAGFTGDTHTADYTAGAVRGQLSAVPVGGVDTGLGGMQDDTSGAAYLGGAALAGAAAIGGALVLRRRVRA